MLFFFVLQSRKVSHIKSAQVARFCGNSSLCLELDTSFASLSRQMPPNLMVFILTEEYFTRVILKRKREIKKNYDNNEEITILMDRIIKILILNVYNVTNLCSIYNHQFTYITYVNIFF